MSALEPLLLALGLGCAQASGPPPSTSSPAPPAPAPSSPVVEKPMITSLTAGLRPEHLGARPLLDRVEGQRHGRVQARRTYPDGAQYLAFLDPQAPGETPTWTAFPALSAQGVAELRRAVEEELLSGKAGGQPLVDEAGPSGGAGTLTWVAYGEAGEVVVRTPSGSYDRLPAFVRRLDEAVSQGVQRAE